MFDFIEKIKKLNINVKDLNILSKKNDRSTYGIF